MTPKPAIVVCLFDQKSGPARDPNNAKLAEMERVQYTASDIIRYCARLDLLPGPCTPPVDVPLYITRDGKVGAVAFRNFQCDDNLASMARELEHDARMASHSIKRPWIHGCISIDASPEDHHGQPEDLLKMGDALMKAFGVEENRYMLAVHLDSNNIHIHFFYARVDSEGRLRERDRKMPKFMAEEATALLAHEFGFSLAPRHLSRVTPDGIMDLASESIVRTLDFREVHDGMRKRNAARKKTKRNELLTLALVARHEAKNLLEFRQLLAPHGITYERHGSGAEFIDINGDVHKASDVDTAKRFTPTHLFGGTLLTDFPPTPPEVVQQADEARAYAKLARAVDDGAKLADVSDDDANLASLPGEKASPTITPKPAHNADDEYDRFIADRPRHPQMQCENERRWDASVKASFREKPGRPPASPELPGWPQRMCVKGAFGAADNRPAPITFAGDRYQTIERAGHTEIWSGTELVASIQYSRMAILSNKEEDLRAAMKAAQKAWGSVEIYGRPAFKKKMARLALELGVPITNPELQGPLEEARARLAKRQTPTPAKLPTHAPSAHQPDSGPRPTMLSAKMTTPVDRETSNPKTALQVTLPADANSGSRSVSPGTVEVVGARPEAPSILASIDRAGHLSEPITNLIDRADRERWDVTLVRHEGNPRALLVPPNGEHAPDRKQQFSSDFQNLLRPLFERQRRDHDLMIKAANAGDLRLELINNGSQNRSRDVVTSLDREVLKLWQSYKNQTSFTTQLLTILRQNRSIEQERAKAVKAVEAAQEAKRNHTRKLAQMLAAGPTENLDAKIVTSAERNGNKLLEPPEALPGDASEKLREPAINHAFSTIAPTKETAMSPNDIVRVGGPSSHISQAEREQILRPRVLGTASPADPPAVSQKASTKRLSEDPKPITTTPQVDPTKPPTPTQASEQNVRRSPTNADVERNKLLDAYSKGFGR